MFLEMMDNSSNKHTVLFLDRMFLDKVLVDTVRPMDFHQIGTGIREDLVILLHLNPHILRE